MSMDQLMALVPIEAASVREPRSGRKSRWERPRIRKSKSRFGPPDERPYLPPAFVDIPPGISSSQLDQFLREQRLEELSFKLTIGQLEEGDPDIRDPSPPPTYDRMGNRTNTRDVRVRSAMYAEHQMLIDYCIKTVDGYAPPPDYKPCKKVRRIMIPQDKYPEYNFMGLIIGPRGCNHKRLEVESGAQISIRGRGTQKEGKKTDQTDEEAALPQHVHIAADSESKLEKAASLIEPLLDPFHPMHEEFKKRGLEQLALVNGVQLSKSEQRCAVCGATGHLAWECPDMQHQSFKKAEVKCAYCGDHGHVTMDCKIAKEQGVKPEELLAKQEEQRKEAAAQPPPPPPPMMPIISPTDVWRVDAEYRKMMSELSGQSMEQLDQIQRQVPPPPPPGVASPQFAQPCMGVWGGMMVPPPPNFAAMPPGPGEGGSPSEGPEPINMVGHDGIPAMGGYPPGMYGGGGMIMPYGCMGGYWGMPNNGMPRYVGAGMSEGVPPNEESDRVPQPPGAEEPASDPCAPLRVPTIAEQQYNAGWFNQQQPMDPHLWSGANHYGFMGGYGVYGGVYGTGDPWCVQGWPPHGRY